MSDANEKFKADIQAIHDGMDGLMNELREERRRAGFLLDALLKIAKGPEPRASEIAIKALTDHVVPTRLN